MTALGQRDDAYVEVNFRFRALPAEKQTDGSRPQLRIRLRPDRAHPGRTGNVGRFSEADISSAHAFDRHVPDPDIGRERTIAARSGATPHDPQTEFGEVTILQ
jgi:hypothetical protein